MAILTIENLLKNKIKNEDKFIFLNIEQMGGEIKIRVPKVLELQEIKSRLGEDYSLIADKVIFENCVEPKLNDEILVTNLKCKNEPYKVVTQIFGEDVKMAILEKILDEIDQKEVVKKVEDIKN